MAHRSKWRTRRFGRPSGKPAESASTPPKLAQSSVDRQEAGSAHQAGASVASRSAAHPYQGFDYDFGAVG